MKKLLLIFIVIFLVGCGASEPPEQEFEYKDSDNTPFVSEVEQAVKEESKAEPKEPSIPKEGIITFSADAKTVVPSIDSTATVEMDVEGKINYNINEKGLVKGSGDGTVNIDLKTDLGIATCSGSKKVQIKYDITGIYDKKSNQIIYKSHDTKPSSTVLNLNCPTQFGDLDYEITLPILFFVGEGAEGDLILEYEDGAVTKKKISHPIPDWDTKIQADWTFELSFLSGFDFDVEVDPAIVSVVQGGTVTPSITVKLVSGTAKDVGLTVTSWPTIKSFITNPTVTPTEVTTLTIETSCDTEPDNYLFTVRGETSGTFKTSVDSVSVQVSQNDKC